MEQKHLIELSKLKKRYGLHNMEREPLMESLDIKSPIKSWE